MPRWYVETDPEGMHQLIQESTLTEKYTDLQIVGTFAPPWAQLARETAEILNFRARFFKQNRIVKHLKLEQ